MKRASRLLCLVAALAAWAALSCAPAGFQNPTVVTSVRVLASSADQPYAKPGSTVTLQVLAYDGRPTRPEPMTIYWLPFPCINPLNDAYYACFSQFAAGAAGDGGSSTPAFDLTSLPTGPSFQFAMPADAIATHPAMPGMQAPYGLAIVFNIACAGHLELVPLDPDNVQAPPVACFDAQHNRLGPDDYVFGFTRVYAYDQLENANPVIQSIDSSVALDPTTGGLTVPHCAGSCTAVHIGPVVPGSSQELDPAQRDVQGDVLHEQIWAEYFSTFGSFTDDVRLMYDPVTGSLGRPIDTDDQFQPPNQAGDGFLWIVVHDNRGGASWATVPVHVD